MICTSLICQISVYRQFCSHLLYFVVVTHLKGEHLRNSGKSTQNDLPGNIAHRLSWKMCFLWLLNPFFAQPSHILCYLKILKPEMCHHVFRNTMFSVWREAPTKMLAHPLCLWLSLSKWAKQQTFCFGINVFYLFGELHISSSPPQRCLKPFRDVSGIQLTYGGDRRAVEAARLRTPIPTCAVAYCLQTDSDTVAQTLTEASQRALPTSRFPPRALSATYGDATSLLISWSQNGFEVC